MDMVSIIVPIYKVEQELSRCVSSIIAQTYKNIEIILVDDGSPDNCKKICDEFSKKDSRIKVIHKKNGGLVNARKSGLESSSGCFVSYVDGDDWIEPNFIEYFVIDQQKNDADIVATGFSKDIGDISEKHRNSIPVGFYDKYALEKQVYPKMICAGEYFYFGICSYLWNKLFKREILFPHQMTVDEKISVGEDTAVTFPALLSANSLYISDNYSYHYFQKPFSMLKSLESLNRETEKVNVLERYLVGAFSKYSGRYGIDAQVARYISSLRIIRCGENGDCGKNIFDVAENVKLAVFGGGIVGQNIYSIFASKKICNLVGWFDRDSVIYRGQGLPVDPVDEIKNFEFDIILIANLDEKSIKSALKILDDFGIEKNKVVSLI